MEMREEVFSTVGAQDMDTSVYQVSDLDDFIFFWENDQLDVDAVLRPGVNTCFSPSTLNNFDIGSKAENPILIDEEHDRENSPPHPTTPVSERPNQPPMLMRNRPFERRIESVAEHFYGKLVE